MASTDSLPQPKKNVAYRVIFPIYDADGDLVSGATGLDSEVSKDCGTFADCTNEATEIATSSGMYYLDLSSTEMNADSVAIIVKTSSSGAKTTPIVLYPEEAGDIRADVTAISGDSAAADNLEAACDGNTYNVGGGAVVAASVTAEVTANITKISGDTAAADNAEAFFDGTGYAGTGNTIPTVTAVTNGVSIADDAITAAALAADALAEIKAEVEAVMSTVTRAELSAVPAANASLVDKLTWITMLLRNKRTQSDTTETVFADDGTTEIATSDKDVTAGIMTRGEYTDVP